MIGFEAKLKRLTRACSNDRSGQGAALALVPECFSVVPFVDLSADIRHASAFVGSDQRSKSDAAIAAAHQAA